MKAFGTYISKYLLSFFAFALALLLINILAFALTFGGIVFRQYGSAAPANMLEAVAADLLADSVNQASQVLSRQNQARANWISGASHDIRTPLSMIMGYAGRIASDMSASGNIHQEAEIIRTQSAKIKELVQNSIHHNPQGCTIRLRLDCSDASVSLSVADNGVGLSAAAGAGGKAALHGEYR